MNPEERQKHMILVGRMVHETMEKWIQWAAEHGYTVEERQLHELMTRQQGKSELVILDSYGLNEAPLTGTKPTLVILDEIRDPLGEALATHLIKTRPEPMKVECAQRRRSKGDRKGRRHTRWT